jgi:Uma2 family endonuclease
MSTVAAPEKLLSVKEFLALPDDGRERWLIEGKVYPREPAMSVRNKKHGRVTTRIAHLLEGWLEAQPQPRGSIYTGDTGFRLKRAPDSLVGIDVAYASAVSVARDDEEPYFDAPPILAVEILSPSDKHEEVVRRIAAYRGAGVITWEVDPDFRRITVHFPDGQIQLLSSRDELIGDPYLPGFRVAVQSIFA